MNRRRRGALTLALLVVLGGAACGSDSKVGDESILNFEEQINDGLGQTTTTVAAAAPVTAPPAGGPATTATTAAATKTTQGGTATTRATTATTQAVATTVTTAKVEEAVLEISIQSDSAGKGIEPEYARAYVGTKVRWVNKDTVARSVVSTTGEFRSPSIPAGGFFEYAAGKVGIFDYGDGTRPYVNAILEILEAP